MRLLLLSGAIGLAACQPGNGYNDGPREDHVDPGPNQIANALVRLADTAVDAAEQPIELRVNGIWADDGLWYILQDGGDWTAIAEIEFGRPAYPMTLYRMPSGVQPSDPDSFADLTPDQLELAEGCAILFERTGPGDYLGQTEGTDCTSSRVDTAYETLEVVIGDSLIWSRRGFDADGIQLWGPQPAR
ncbi:MAG: CpcT/CpeT family chromophore lyase [Bacteroidota bacterium]